MNEISHRVPWTARLLITVVVSLLVRLHFSVVTLYTPVWETLLILARSASE